MRTKNNSIILSLGICLSVFISLKVYTQTDNYITQYSSGNYKDSLETINRRLEEIYIENLQTLKIPNEFITTKDNRDEIDLRLLFKKHKAGGFFIEDKKDLSDLHLYAGRCYYQTSKYKDSLNNLIQALRYKKLDPSKDHAVFYEISQVFKKMNLFNPYTNALEAAYTMSPDNSAYSLEIGLALYATSDTKRAIYHFERYITNTDDTIDPDIYLKLANLYDSTRQYLKAERYYIEYLKKKPDDGSIHLALGVLTYKKTGHHDLALASLNKSIDLLPEKEIAQRSMAFEIKGDIEHHNQNYTEAIKAYTATIQYQDEIRKKIHALQKDIKELSDNLNRLKKSLIKDKLYDQYEEYEYLQEQKGKKDAILRDLETQFTRLHAGRIRWNIADTNERLGMLEDAIEYYRQSITFNFKSNNARDKIQKLQLKIKRGY
jgi:lipopolysaccharide biosynthesis regulator YciM